MSILFCFAKDDLSDTWPVPLVVDVALLARQCMISAHSRDQSIRRTEISSIGVTTSTQQSGKRAATGLDDLDCFNNLDRLKQETVHGADT